MARRMSDLATWMMTSLTDIDNFRSKHKRYSREANGLMPNKDWMKKLAKNSKDGAEFIKENVLNFIHDNNSILSKIGTVAGSAPLLGKGKVPRNIGTAGSAVGIVTGLDSSVNGESLEQVLGVSDMAAGAVGIFGGTAGVYISTVYGFIFVPICIGTYNNTAPAMHEESQKRGGLVAPWVYTGFK